MKKYCEMSREELLDLKKELDREFDEIKAEVWHWICPVVNLHRISLIFP